MIAKPYANMGTIDEHLGNLDYLHIIMRDMCTAIRYIEDRLHIFNPDIHPKNIALHRAENGQIRAIMIDFGAALTFDTARIPIPGQTDSPPERLHNNYSMWEGDKPDDRILKEGVSKEMSKYRLYNVVPKLFDFIEDLTNWYIRLNRSRFWGEGMDEDKVSAFNTLYSVLYELSKVMAPFAPFLSEHLFRELSALSEDKTDKESVHLCRFPEFDLDPVSYTHLTLPTICSV